MAEVVPSSLPSSPDLQPHEGRVRSPNRRLWPHARPAATSSRAADEKRGDRDLSEVADSLEDNNNPAAHNSSGNDGANLSTQRYSFSPLVVHEPVLLPSDDELDLGTQQATQRDVIKFSNASRAMLGGGVAYLEQIFREESVSAYAAFTPAVSGAKEHSTALENLAYQPTPGLGSPDILNTPAVPVGTHRRSKPRDDLMRAADDRAPPQKDQTKFLEAGNRVRNQAVMPRERENTGADAKRNGIRKRVSEPAAESPLNYDGDCAEDASLSLKTKRRRLLSSKARLQIISSQESNHDVAAPTVLPMKPGKNVEWRRPSKSNGNCVGRGDGNNNRTGVQGLHEERGRGSIQDAQGGQLKDAVSMTEMKASRLTSTVTTRRLKVIPSSDVRMPHDRSSMTTNGNVPGSSAHSGSRVGRATLTSLANVVTSAVDSSRRTADRQRQSRFSDAADPAPLHVTTRAPTSNTPNASAVFEKVGIVRPKVPAGKAALSRRRVTTASDRSTIMASSTSTRKSAEVNRNPSLSPTSTSLSSPPLSPSEEDDVNNDPDYVSDSSGKISPRVPVEDMTNERGPPFQTAETEEEEEEDPPPAKSKRSTRQRTVRKAVPAVKAKGKKIRGSISLPAKASGWTSPPRRAAAIAALPKLVESPPSKVKKPAKNRVTPAPVLAASAIFRECGFVVTKIDVANDEVPDDEAFDLKSVIRLTRDSVEEQIRSGGGIIFPDFAALFTTPNGSRRRFRATDAGLTSAQLYAAGTVERVYLIASAPKKTAKYLVALALGVPRVSAAWVGECCSENKLLDIEPFALSNGFSLTLNAYCGSFSGPSGIFEGLRIGLSGDKEWKKSYEAILRAGGAVEVTDFDDLAKPSSSRAKRRSSRNAGPCDVIVTAEPPRTAEVRRAPRKVPGRCADGHPVVSKEWVNECLITQRIHPVERFVIEERPEAAMEEVTRRVYG